MTKIWKIEECNADGCPLLRLGSCLECPEKIFVDGEIVPGPNCPLENYSGERACEWKESHTKQYYKPSCDPNGFVRKVHAIYCPFCGGKIVVKEKQ
jgi:hypothetical protein